MKKSAAFLLVSLLALGGASLRADTTTHSFSTTSTPLAKQQQQQATGPSFRTKDPMAASTPGVVYGGLGYDLYKKGPILLSPLAPAKTGDGKVYFSSSALAPENSQPSHAAQKPTGGLSLFSISF